MAQFNDLPEELMIQICQCFCLHCHLQNLPDHGFPDIFAPAEKDNKVTLSRVSKTSRLMRRVAQPIMFHSCATGRVPQGIGLSEWKDFSPDITPSNALQTHILALLLRTLVQRPDLASQVSALSLVPYHGPFSVGHVHYIDPDTWNMLIEPLGLVRRQPKNYLPPLSILEPTVVASVPNLKSLLLCPGPGKDYTHWTSLPQLKHLAVTAWGEIDYHIADLKLIFEKTPHLEVLDASDCGCGSDDDVAMGWDDKHEWNLSLSNVRKLTINDLKPAWIRKLLGYCPKLEDLELHINPVTIDVPEITDFEPCRKSLRRFKLSISRPDVTTGANDSSIDADDAQLTDDDELYRDRNAIYHFLREEDDAQLGYSLQEFEALQILEIDQCALFGFKLERTDVTQLSYKMPQTIVTIHLGFVINWTHLFPLFEDLLRRRGRGEFRSLDTVCIDPFFREEKEREEVEEVKERFAAEGVGFVVGRNPSGKRIRGMLPERPGGADCHDQ